MSFLKDGREEQTLVLASASETRASLLRGAGVPFRLCPSEVEEASVKDRLLERGYGGVTVARRLAEEKALDISARLQNALVLGGDQTLTLGSRQFSKASNRSEVIQVLTALSGRDHQLHAAYAFARRGRLISSGIESAILRLRRLDADEIAHYVDAAGPAVYKSVGGYQIEALGRGLFEQIAGDHSTILGLPLTPVLRFWRLWTRSRSEIQC